MPTTVALTEEIFQSTIQRAVQDVCKTMVSMKAELARHARCERTEAGLQCGGIAPPSGDVIIGTVGFVGDIAGLIYLYLPVTLAQHLAGKMLGMTPVELKEAGDDVVNDAVGELTNMTVGAFKNVLCDQGYPCKLTIPSIMRGANFSIQSTAAATRRLYEFNIEGHMLVADLLVKDND
jgi:chemotaxis protein CheX